ncbi:hypothetical protein HDV06_005157 [Boothiomyces sp. JEL0866]|nr:hypothetical protein HDV06_005157 [Boothiomyces sp. JEL0866]
MNLLTDQIRRWGVYPDALQNSQTKSDKDYIPKTITRNFDSDVMNLISEIAGAPTKINASRIASAQNYFVNQTVYVPAKPTAIVRKNEVKDFIEERPELIPNVYDSKETERNDSKIKNENHCDAIDINWKPVSAQKKLQDHTTEIEKNIIEHPGHVSHQLEQQRIYTEAAPKKLKLKPKVIHHSTNITINYLPHHIYKGFSDEEQQAKHAIPQSFIHFPQPNSNSVIYHTIQGKLARKIKQNIQEPISIPKPTCKEPHPSEPTRMDSVADLSMYIQCPVNNDSKSSWKSLYSWIGRNPPSFWKLDNSSSECTECTAKFTTFNRRHHCRLCGNIFCHKCSRYQCEIDLNGKPKPGNYERTCGNCFVIHQTQDHQ